MVHLDPADPPMKHLLLSLYLVTASSLIGQVEWNQEIPGGAVDADGKQLTCIQNLAGVCAVVRSDKQTGMTYFSEILEGGAAEKAGLKAKDVLVLVDGITIHGMDLNSVVNLLRGVPGTKVSVTVLREGGRKIFEVVREKVVFKNPTP